MSERLPAGYIRVSVVDMGGIDKLRDIVTYMLSHELPQSIPIVNDERSSIS